jgi:hypothetical protein
LPGQPSNLGSIVVGASTGSAFGTSAPISPRPGEITDVGDIRLLSSSVGTEFVFAIPNNFLTQTVNLTISGDSAAAGTVEVPGLPFTRTFAIAAGGIVTIDLPLGAMATASNAIERLGVHVTSNTPVVVYGLNRFPQTTDAFTALPVSALGTRHRVMSFSPLLLQGQTRSEFTVTGVQNETRVTITPSADGEGRPRGMPFDLVLNRFDVYQLKGALDDPDADLTGTLVVADKPVSVSGAHECAFVPVDVPFCDHLVETMPHLAFWGLQYFSVDLANRPGADTFRILADQDATHVVVEGANPLTVTLDAGEFFETLLDGTNVIRSDRPILVAQYANGSEFDGSTGDPFMMLLTPAERFRSSYRFATPVSGFASHFVNIVTLTGATTGIFVNGVEVDPGAFRPVATSGFSGAQIPIRAGTNTITATRPLGAYVYGFGSFDSYGYPAGM